MSAPGKRYAEQQQQRSNSSVDFDNMSNDSNYRQSPEHSRTSPITNDSSNSSNKSISTSSSSTNEDESSKLLNNDNDESPTSVGGIMDRMNMKLERINRQQQQQQDGEMIIMAVDSTDSNHTPPTPVGVACQLPSLESSPIVGGADIDNKKLLLPKDCLKIDTNSPEDMDDEKKISLPINMSSEKQLSPSSNYHDAANDTTCSILAYSALSLILGGATPINKSTTMSNKKKNRLSPVDTARILFDYDDGMYTVPSIDPTHDNEYGNKEKKEGTISEKDVEVNCTDDIIETIVKTDEDRRAFILEQHGWEHHHRYARHRLSSLASADMLQQPRVVPLNRVSSALVVNPGGSSGTTSDIVMNDISAKNLNELRILTDELMELRAYKVQTEEVQLVELSELRAWKDDATKLLDEHADQVDSLRMERDYCQKELADRQSDIDGYQNELTVIKDEESVLLKERDHHEQELACKDSLIDKLEECVKSTATEGEDWRVAAEEAAIESSKEMTALRSEVDTLREELEEFEREAEQKMIEAASENKARLSKKDEALATLKQGTDVEIAQKVSALTNLTAEVDELKTQLEDSKVENQNLKSLLDTTNEEKQEVDGKENMFNELVKAKELTIDNLSVEVSVLKTKLEDSKVEKHKMKTLLDSAFDEKQKVQEQLKSKLSKAMVAMEEKENIITELVKAKADGDELQEELESKLSSQSDQFRLLNTTIEQLQSGLQTKHEENIKLHTEYGATSKKLRGLQERVDTADLAIENLTNELQDRDEIIKAKTNKIGDLQEELTVIKAATSDERQRLEAIVQAREEEADQLKTDIKQISSDSSQLHAKLNDRMDLASEEIRRLRDTLKKAEVHLENSAAKTKSVLAEKAIQVELVSKLESSIKSKEGELKHSKLQLQNVSQEVIELQKELKVVNLELSLLKSTNEENTSTSDISAQIIEEKAKEVNNLRKALDEKGSELIQTKKELVNVKNDLEETVKLSRKKGDELDASKLVSEATAKEVSELKETLRIAAKVTNDLRLELEEIGMQGEEKSEGLADRIAELENEVNRQRSKYQNARKALAEMEQALVVRRCICCYVCIKLSYDVS